MDEQLIGKSIYHPGGPLTDKNQLLGRTSLYKEDGTPLEILSAEETNALFASGVTMVRTYVGDDVTNPSAVRLGVQQAIAAAGVNGTLVFDPREYQVVGTSTYQKMLSPLAGQTWVGRGARLVSQSTHIGPWILAVEVDDVTISGFTFTSANVTDAIGIYLAGCSGTKIVENRFGPVNRSGGVHGKGDIQNLLISRNHFIGSGYGILLDDVVSEVAQTRAIVITDNVFDGLGSPGDGIEINRPTTAAKDITITGNTVSNYDKTVENDGFGIGLANCQNVTISGNFVTTCARNGIHVEDDARYITISNNVVTACEHAGIEVQTASGWTISDISIVGNTVSGCCTVPSAGFGLGGIDIAARATGDNGAAARRIICSGNVSSANNGHGISGFQAYYSSIDGNICSDNVGGGIYVSSCLNTSIQGNVCTDSRAGGSKTQTYGMIVANADSGALYGMNMLEGNLTGRMDISTTGQVFESIEYTGDGLKVGGLSNTKLGFFGANPVVRPSGWGAATGSATRTTFDTTTVTTAQLAERVKALIDDFELLGLIV